MESWKRLSSVLFSAGFLALLLFAGTGCGLLINGTKQKVSFIVEPKDAKIFVDGKEIAGSVVDLERKKSHRYRIEHPDYELKEGSIPNRISLGPALLDLLFWPVLFVDIPLGALNKFEKDRIVVNLEPIGSTPKPAHVAKADLEKSTRQEPPESSVQDRQTQPTQHSVTQPRYESQGERWALVVGISQYEDGRIPKIPNAADDARAVRDFLVHPEGGQFSPDHVFLLTDYDATTRKLERYLKNELRRKVQREDDLFLYFACHGMAVPKPGTGSEDGLEKYLIPYDTISEDVMVDGLSMTDLEEALNSIECQQVAMVLDTCFSGGARSISTGPATRNTTVSSSFLKKLAKQRGTKRKKVVTACSADELAQDDPGTEHGIFTTYFLEGLKQGQDSDGNGFVSLYEVFRYLDRKVRERSAEIGQRQHPQWVGDPAYPFLMKRISP